MTDKTASVSPENTTSALSHLAFCALVALGLALALSGNLAAQSDLFRLTYASETLKDQGWDNYVLDAHEWKSGVTPVPSQHNGFYVEKAALNAAFAQDGRHLHSVPFRVVGDADRFIHVMAEYGLCTRRLGSTSASHTIARSFADDTAKPFGKIVGEP